MYETIQSVLIERGLAVGNLTLYFLLTSLLALVVKFGIEVTKFFYRRWRDEILLKEFDGPKPTFLRGNIQPGGLGKGMIRRCQLLKEYGPVFKFHLGPNYRQLVLCDPEYIKTIMSTSEPKDQVGYRFIKPWIGDGLLISSGKKWVRNRRLLTPGFHFDILKPYQEIFSNCANILVEKWKKMKAVDSNQSFEMFEHVSLMTLDGLMKCVFGVNENVQVNSKEKNPYIKGVYEMADLISHRFANPLYHNDIIYYLSSSGRKFRKAYSYSQQYTRNVIDRKRKELSENGNKKEDCNSGNRKRFLDFLDILLACRDSEGQSLSDEEIQNEVDTFMFEGHDTTASGISWCLYNLARHPEIQEKCRNEVQNILGERNIVEWDDLNKLDYLTMCIKESLRTHPPVSGIGRVTTQERKLPDGRKIPVGTWVSLSIYTCHHNPKYWPDPDKYDPERFAPEAIKDRHPHAFIPFSAGPRNCIGQHFAMNELKTKVALLVKNLRFSVDESRPADPMLLLILRSKNGLWLKVDPVEK